MAIPKKLKIELPYDPAIPFLDIYPNKMKTLMWKDICIPVYTVTLFKIARIWKQPKCPSTDAWTKNVTYMYTHTHTHTHARASQMAQWSRIHLQCRKYGFNPWVRKTSWRRKRQPAPILLSGRSHGQ